MNCDSFRKFPKIGQLHQAVRHAHKLRPDARPAMPLTYRGTVKLHGTNAGVRLSPSGRVVCVQSRNRVLTVEDDNMGFAAFIFDEHMGAHRRALLAAVADEVRSRRCVVEAGCLAEDVTLYGEWCGPGIQKGVALNSLPERQFVLFSAAVGDDGPRVPAGGVLASTMPIEAERVGIMAVRDAGAVELRIDLLSPESVAEKAATIARITEEYEARCPWGEMHGIRGVGEGLVWVPVGPAYDDPELWFKTKGEQHKGKPRTRVQVGADPAKVEGVGAFIRLALAEDRLRQGLDYLREMGKPVEVRSTGDFLRWVAGDVQAELGAELEAGGLEWRDVAKRLGGEARAWFMRRCEEVAP